MTRPLRSLARAQTLALSVLTLVALMGATAQAQSKSKLRKKRAEAKLRKVSKKLNVDLDALRKAGGERFLSRKSKVRRALLAAIAAKRPPELVPVVVALALSDKDLEIRESAVKLLSVVGLDADRDAYLDSVMPALAKLVKDKHQNIHLGAADEARTLARWFKHDQEVAAFFEALFDGKHYPLAVRGWKGLIDLANADVREGVVQRAMREVQDRRSRFAVFERRRSFRENGPRGGPWEAKALAALVIEDGTVAVSCTQALADLGDPVALPYLRRIGRTSAHVLRIPALMTRGILGDSTLLGELEETLDSDHVAIKAALIAAVAKLEHKRVDPILARLSKGANEPVLQQAIALARLERDDDGDAELLGDELDGAKPSRRIARAVLATEARAAQALVVRIAQSSADPLKSLRRRAVARIGDEKIDSKPVRELLRSLQKRDPKDALRLQAAASLLQLGEAKSDALVEAALKDYDVVNRTEVTTPVGKGRRFNGSPLISVLQRLGRTETLAAVPLLAKWLDPPLPVQPKAVGPGDDTTKERKLPEEVAPPTLPEWLAHPFVRREAVAALGALALALDARVKTPGKADDKAAAEDTKTQRLLALRALVRSLSDTQGVVRRAAIRALVTIGGGELPVGASLDEEDEALSEVQQWLKTQPLK
jgi:hypothetical protein